MGATDYQQIPKFNGLSHSLTRISRIFQMDICSEVNAERISLRNQEQERIQMDSLKIQTQHI